MWLQQVARQVANDRGARGRSATLGYARADFPRPPSCPPESSQSQTSTSVERTR
ncbi:hypothetical protein JYU34_018709 [Plutella xylostella]|uniref:Uncharacterized protein n=1 Tax=Plutella xylostella TaxID=51655 RepID=A0ABQ7PY97_PLUXY|nr:hypothetical protein JYU34_018709 [Plutella xylostella]